MQTFCTIVTPSFLSHAKALHESLKKHDPKTTIQVLVIGDSEIKSEKYFIIHQSTSIINYSLAKDIENKYAYTNTDHFRWALKPVFISYLLENGFEKVIYVDPDIFFVNDYSFLFEKLNTRSVLLSPHWRDTDPLKNEENFLALYKDGLYNGGFIAASKKGIEAMKWWAGLCHYKMDRQIQMGIYDDQRYLDAMPAQFDNIEILKHRGCNIAKWNINECKRELKNGNLVINGEYPIIFIHFTFETIQEILNGTDQILQPYLEEYKTALEKEGINFPEFINLKNKNILQLVKEKTLIRTRIKRFFYRLAQRL